MRQWDGSQGKYSQEHSCDFLSSVTNNNTTEVSGKAFLSTSNLVKPLGDRGSAPDPAEELTTLPLSALRASNIVTFGHSFYAPKLKS